jgi:hypothetical protein
MIDELNVEIFGNNDPQVRDEYNLISLTDDQRGQMPTDCTLITMAELIALLQTLPPDDVYPMLQHRVFGGKGAERWSRVTVLIKNEPTNDFYAGKISGTTLVSNEAVDLSRLREPGQYDLNDS